MKVLQLISSGGNYGAENMLLNLIGSGEPGISQNLLAVFHNRHCPNTELYDRAVQRGVHAELVACRGRLDGEAVRNIRRFIHKGDVDLVHTHGYKADLYGYAAARLEGKPVVATCHNWLAGGATLAAYNLLDRIALKRFDALSAVSQTVAEKLLSFGVRRERITVIPNGVELDAFAQEGAGQRTRDGQSERVIGIVARLDLKKGFEYLLGALRHLHSDFPGLRLLIVGDGPDRAKIEHLVREQGLGGLVKIAGQQTNMPAVYASMDIFVLPSLNEGLPMTLLEAMAARKPIIATRVGAVPTVITNGETGLLVEPADEAGLTRAMAALLEDPALGRRLAERARAHVARNFTAEAMIQRYREVYQAVLDRREGRWGSGRSKDRPVSAMAAGPGGTASSPDSGTSGAVEAGPCVLNS